MLIRKGDKIQQTIQARQSMTLPEYLARQQAGADHALKPLGSA